jgi:ribulose 1,5-bisphosphate synthetase/thiazole synthase
LLSQGAPLPENNYDVIVVGSEPEGISAAIAAAESGSRTLLVTSDARLGGLFVLGELNVLDLRTQPVLYQQGLFLRWWRRVGRQPSFDVRRAEEVFETMLDEAGVDVIFSARDLAPYTPTEGIVSGVFHNGTLNLARQVIDATADMNFAAVAGAGFSVGFSSIGHDARMVDTLIFRVANVDWERLQKGVTELGHNYASIRGNVAWGSFGGYPAAYEPSVLGIKLRGLNLGRQDDGTVLINALLLFDVDPFDAASLTSGRERASQEAARIVNYLSEGIPGFENARLQGTAERLYIRETRHLEARCTLTIDDVIDNRVTPFDIAAGGYPLDVQPLTPFDSGFVFGVPEVYGVQLCVSVPQDVTNLWVVGKAAGYDPIAAASARVVPFGMAVAEAVGIAAAEAARLNVSSHYVAKTPEMIEAVRTKLLQRGAYLPQVKARDPVGPIDHPNYHDYRVLLSRGLAVGGYQNDPRLDEPVSALSYLYLLSNVGRRFHQNRQLGPELIAHFGDIEGPLSTEVALQITSRVACELGVCVEAATWQTLRDLDLAPQRFGGGDSFTRGDMYSLASRLARLSP